LADIKLVGAVAIKVRPDAKGFRGETQRQVKKALAGLDAEVKVKLKAETAEAERDVDRAKEAIEKKGMTLKVGLDHDSVRRAQKQLDSALKGLADEVIKVTFDDEGIAKAQAKLDEMAADAQVEMTFVPDEKGYKAVLDKIAALRREKIEQEISFDIDDDSLDALEADMLERLSALSRATVDITYTSDRASLQKAIDKVDDQLKEIRSQTFEIELDEASLLAARKRLEKELAETPVELKVDYDDQASLKATRDRLQEMLAELRSKTLTVGFNEEAIRSELNRINEMIDDEVKEERKVELPVHTTGLELVARQLQFASRARRVPFHVVVDQKSVLIAEGILRSLAGVNTLQAAGRGLENLITKFDTISLKAAGWGSAIGGIADSLIYLTTQAFAVGDGMFEVVGLLATAPTALASIAAATVVTIMAFDNMKKALDGDKKALEKLPPAARDAVKSLDGVWESMQRPVQQAFWEGMGDSVRDFVDRTVPILRKGLVQIADDMGRFGAGVAAAFDEAAISGSLQTMFNNLEQFFAELAKAAKPLIDALNILGLRGSEFLPRFGRALLDVTNQFHDWIVESDRLGNINAWIEDGVNSLKDMFFAGKAIADQFKAISRAAGLIGSNGLDDFRRSMEHIAEVMLAEPFQTKMGSIFFGARQGATELNKGVKDLAGSFADSAFWTGQLLTLLGKFGGEVLSGVSRTIGNFNFQQGLLTSLRGMSDMVKIMTPAFERLGDMIGNVGEVSGAVFPGLGQVFNTAFRILDDALESVADNLAEFAPTLLNLTDNLLGFARGPILFLAEGLNNFLEVLNNLPGPIRDVVVTFGAFLLLRNQFGSFTSALSRLWTNLTTTSVKGTAAVATAIDGTGRAVNNVNKQLVIMSDGSVRQMNRFGTIMSGGISRGNAAVGRFNPSGITGKLGAVVGGVAGAVGRINASLALIGGIPGLILGGLGVVLATIGGNAADAAASIDELRASLDKVTGKATGETLQTIAGKISEIDKAGDAWANFWRGVMLNARAGNETLDKLGINISQAAQIITGSRGAFDSFVGSLEKIGQAGNLEEVVKFMRDGSLPKVLDSIGGPGSDILPQAKIDAIKQTAEAIKSLKLDPGLFEGEGAIRTQDIENLTSKMHEQRKAFELAQLQQGLYAQALGTSIDKSREVAAIVQTIGDRSLDAAGKIDAINRSLELLNNNGLSEQESKIARLDSLEIAVENAKAIAGAIEASRKTLFNSNGLINEQSKAGRDLFKIMAEAADNVKIQAQATYDAAIKNGETAQAAADKATAVVKSGDADLKAIAAASGLTVEQLKTQWGAFFGSEWELEATFSANTDNFLAGQAEANRLGIEFNGKEFMAWLLANPDPAKVTTDQVKEYIRQYAVGHYEAQLKALPLPALQSIAQAVGAGDAFKRRDYTAILEAFNNAGPGVQDAILSIGRLTNASHQATISAILNHGSLAAVEYALIQASRPRTAVINVTYSDAGRDSAMANRVRGGGSRNGSILDGFGRGIAGFDAERIKFFANGGIEKHIASIFPASSNVRVFAEPETGGEAYIPLAASKRPRSLAILTEVARMFGYSLNRNMQQYGNGGGYGRTSPTTNNTASVHIGTLVTTDADAAVKKIRTSQQDALAVAGISLNGA
jgi:hypothetical protein